MLSIYVKKLSNFIVKMFKRIFDIFVSFIGLIVLSPILIFVLFLVWLQDRKNPLYFGERVGKAKKFLG